MLAKLSVDQALMKAKSHVRKGKLIEAKKLYEDKNFLNQVLSSGAIRARQISQKTISDVYKIAGMI